MSKKTKADAPSRRRDFLKFATLGAVAGAAAISGKSGKAEAGMKTAAENRSAGYRETEHVKKAYELSRF